MSSNRDTVSFTWCEAIGLARIIIRYSQPPDIIIAVLNNTVKKLSAVTAAEAERLGTSV